jgi:hypothetical protein
VKVIRLRVLPWMNRQAGYTAFAGEQRIGSAKRVAGRWAVWLKGSSVQYTEHEANAVTLLRELAKESLLKD